MKHWLRRGALVLSIGYPVALLLVLALCRFVGERVWVTDIVLYLPRIGFAFPLPFVLGGTLWYGDRRLLWLSGLSVYLIVFPLMGLTLPALSHGSSVHTLRVFSFNVNSASAGEDVVAASALESHADIVAFQEAGTHAAALGKLLSKEYPYVVASTQFVTASRFPISETRDPEKLMLYGNARSPRFLRHLVKTPLGDIAFYNIHPISPREGFSAIRGDGLRREIRSGRLLSRANVPVLRANSLLRGLQVESISAMAHAEIVPVILAGDTNLPTQSMLFGKYLSDFSDGFREAGVGFGYTFPVNKRPWMRIDRILASHSLRFVRFETGSSKVSDHRSVVADIGLAD